MDVRGVFENKEEARWRWDGRDRWKMFEIEKPVRALFVQVDPEHVLLLDPRLGKGDGLMHVAVAAPVGIEEGGLVGDGDVPLKGGDDRRAPDVVDTLRDLFGNHGPRRIAFRGVWEQSERRNFAVTDFRGIVCQV